MNGTANLPNGHIPTNGDATTKLNRSIVLTHASLYNNTSATFSALISAGTEAKTTIRSRIASFGSSESTVIVAVDVFLFPNEMKAV